MGIPAADGVNTLKAQNKEVADMVVLGLGSDSEQMFGGDIRTGQGELMLSDTPNIIIFYQSWQRKQALLSLPAPVSASSRHRCVQSRQWAFHAS